LSTDFTLSSADKYKEVLPALIGAGLCLFLRQSAVWGFFFLVPFGFLALRYGIRITQGALFFAITGNIVLTLGTAFIHGIPLGGVFPDILYFTAMVSLFTAITAPPPRLAEKASEGVRLFAGSGIAAALVLGIFFRRIADEQFLEFLNSVLESVIALQQSSGSNVVENAILEAVTLDQIIALTTFIMLRGGALISSVLMFFLSRQIALTLFRISTRIKVGSAAGAAQRSAAGNFPPLALFRVKPEVIWVFSITLLLSIVSSMLRLAVPEIILWNILILCSMLYLAQGLGILSFFLSKPSSPPLLRLLAGVLLVICVVSPGINAIFLVGVVLLGIAENWVAFRTPISNGTPSTPEAGSREN